MEQVTAAEPGNAGAWHTLGLTHLARQDAAQAVPLLEKAVALEPKNSEMHLQLGHAYGLSAPPGGLFANLGFARKCNAAFDQDLRARDPASGIRDFEAVDALARAQGLALAADHAMPANNQLLLWRR